MLSSNPPLVVLGRGGNSPWLFCARKKIYCAFEELLTQCSKIDYTFFDIIQMLFFSTPSFGGSLAEARASAFLRAAECSANVPHAIHSPTASRSTR
jgi:hypothetical protein